MSGEDSGPDSPSRDPVSRLDHARLLRLAADGDQPAWNELVDRFSTLLWSICRSYGLSAADAADVFQLTWLRLLEHVDSIQDPGRLPGWLATTCRHECLSHLRRNKRSQPTGDYQLLDQLSARSAGADRSSLVADRNALLWRAFSQLSDRCQQLLRVLVVEAADGPPAYGLAAAALDMPVGSLGPTRGRCLAHLRKLLDRDGIYGWTPDS